MKRSLLAATLLLVAFAAWVRLGPIDERLQVIHGDALDVDLVRCDVVLLNWTCFSEAARAEVHRGTERRELAHGTVAEVVAVDLGRRKDERDGRAGHQHVDVDRRQATVARDARPRPDDRGMPSMPEISPGLVAQ